MHPTPEQLEATKAIHRQADELIAAERAKQYAAAPTCWGCGQKIMPEFKAPLIADECRPCFEERHGLRTHETYSEEE